MNQALWIVLSLAAFLTSAHAASFDCRKAQTQVEKLICGNAQLSQLDESLDIAYRKALERIDAREQTIVSQRQWLKNERNACQTDACLETAYNRRIRELELAKSFGIVILQPNIQTTSPQTPASNTTLSLPTSPQTTLQSSSKTEHQATACHAVVKAANEGKLSNLTLKIPLASDWKNGALIDVNNDGRPERAVGRMGGSNTYFGEFDAFDDKGAALEFTRSEKDDWDNDKLRWAQHQEFIQYGGQTYILGSTDEYLHYLSKIEPNNVESVICQFGHRSQPTEALVKSANDRLCKTAARKSFQYASFEHDHNLTAAAIQQAGLRETTAGSTAAMVDIDNDGKLDLVVSLNLASSRGLGCDGEHLGVLNKSRTHLDKKKTSELPDPRCGAVEQSAFVFERQTYIKIKYPARRPSNNHEIVQLKNGQLQTICKFDVRLVHYVLGEYERILENAKAGHIDPWMYALNMPDASGLQAMMDAGHDTRITVNRHMTFPTVLHETIRQEKFDALKLLLERGAKADVPMDRNSPADMPTLIFAVWTQSIQGMQLLLQHGADPEQTWQQQPVKFWVQLWGGSESNKAQMLRLLARR